MAKLVASLGREATPAVVTAEESISCSLHTLGQSLNFNSERDNVSQAGPWLNRELTP